ncbi:MAG: hypothetical protein FD127_852 [Acidimicrobiaceae bacterium]|nr:MAG: hypothetical protein FD127_852 [Acidimicrobiaceae bacterium]
MSRRIRHQLAVAAIVFAVAVPSFAATASADDGDLGTRLARVCARVAPAEQRVSAIIARLEGGADLRGSLAWFDAQIARATSMNRPKIAADLQARRNLLADRLAQLHRRIDRLDRAADFCREKGIAV